MNKFNDFIFALGIIVGVLLLIFLIKTLAVWAVWDFLVVPVWGAKTMTFAQAASLTLFVQVIVGKGWVEIFHDKKD